MLLRPIKKAGALLLKLIRVDRIIIGLLLTDSRARDVRKTGSSIGNLVSRKAFLGPGASFPPY